MANATALPDDPSPDGFDSGLSVPPLDTAFFSQQFIGDDGAIAENYNDDFDLDFSFDDLYIPSAENLHNLFNPNQLPYDTSFPQFGDVFKSNRSELCHGSGDRELSGDQSSGVVNSVSSGSESRQDSDYRNVPSPESNGTEYHQVSDYINVPSPDSNGSHHGGSENCGGEVNLPDCPSPESQVSGNCGSDVSEESNDRDGLSVSSLTRINGVKQKIKIKDPQKSSPSKSLLKRKKDCEDLSNNKHRKSSFNLENNDNNANSGVSEEEEKRNARLVRNRESAQLSRQRKKLYVDELEEKVKMMHSTIQELNAKVSFFMAENVTLRQQIGGGGAVPPPPMAALPPPGMYPHPAMMYPWMPYAPPYMVKPQGSQVPLVPIPRLKPQSKPQAPKVSERAEGKKKDRKETKKVAGISFLGLLFFIMLFGGLVPLVNMKYGGESYVGGGFYEKHNGRLMMVNGSVADGKPNVDGSVRLCNESEPLVASLYVPRNDKLVKIDGNLIIHSVLASEKAMSTSKDRGDETGLAVPGGLVPSNGVRMNGARRPQVPALGSSSVNMDSRQASDGRIQEWFREGLSGPMLSSGMCTEVFQFDVSPASGAIVPATTSRNISEKRNHNSTHHKKGMNRRILRGLPFPLPESSHNISRQHTGRPSQKDNSKGNNSASPMVVSVLVDPGEMGDADADGVMGKKSLSKIFVVVFIDSVKYVTYTCMLPFKGSPLHLVAS